VSTTRTGHGGLTGATRRPRGVPAVITGGAQIAAATVTAPVLRRWYNRWGATAAETAAAMPGDELVPFPRMASTRAITIGAAPAAVWAWLVQIGQGRGGFYSFDALENLVGCHIHSADRIDPGLQELRRGDEIRLAPGQAPSYRVAVVEPPHVLVLAVADPKARPAAPEQPAPRPAAPGQLAATWQWLLRPAGGDAATRLVVRQRYSYPRRQAVLWHLAEPVDFVMERRMLHGIRERAELRRPAGGGDGPGGR
jgi:hypothetical protein